MATNRMTARRFLAREIRLSREIKGVSRDELAQAVFVSEALVRAWETGRRIPQHDHLASVENLLGTGGILRRMLDDLVKGEPTPEYVGRWRQIEIDASSLLWYQPLIIPGLLQTPDYAREIIANSGRQVEDLEMQVEARIDRQKILVPENSMTFVAVIDETVLYRPVGGPKVMREQLMKLLEFARQPNIRIQVIKADTGAYPGLAGGFGVAAMDGQEYVYVDDAFSGDVLEDPEDVAVMKRIWLTLHAEACSAKESIKLIEKAAEKWATS